MTILLLALTAAVVVAAVMLLLQVHQLRQFELAVDGLRQDLEDLPTADQLRRWGEQLQDSLLRGEKEVRSASVQLRQSTDNLAARVQQVERLTGVEQMVDGLAAAAASTVRHAPPMDERRYGPPRGVGDRT